MSVADATPAADAAEHTKDLDNRLVDIAIPTWNALESAGSPGRTRSDPADPEADASKESGNAGSPATGTSLTAPAATLCPLTGLSSNRQPTPTLQNSPAASTVPRSTFSGCTM